MEFKRYGPFHFRDFAWDAVFLFLFLLLAIVLAAARVALWGIPMLLFFIGLRLWLIASAFRERFSLREGGILAKKGRKETVIALPGTLTLIITFADLDSNRFCHDPYDFYQSPQRLRSAYAVTILQNTTLSDAQQILLKGLGQTAELTNSKVHFCFESPAYGYSFVLGLPALEALLRSHTCAVLLPENYPDADRVRACAPSALSFYPAQRAGGAT